MGRTVSLSSADVARFLAARCAVLSESVEWDGIGALSEKSLHKILKLYVEPDSSKHEVKYLGSVADILNEQGVVEIQTRSYEKLYPKLLKFLEQGAVTVVCPLAAKKQVRWIDKESGEISAARKSPKRENIFDAFRLLFGIRGAVPHANLTVRVIYLDVEDFRYLNGWDRTRKRGSVRMERIPNAVLGEELLVSTEDYASCIPDELGDEFTAAELARAVKRTSRYSFYILKLLVACGAIREEGSRGRAALYKRNYPLAREK